MLYGFVALYLSFVCVKAGFLFFIVVAYIVVHYIFFGSVLRCSCITVVIAAYEISPFLSMWCVEFYEINPLHGCPGGFI